MRHPKTFAFLSFLLLATTITMLVLHLQEAESSPQATYDCWKRTSLEEAQSGTEFRSSAANGLQQLTGMNPAPPPLATLPTVSSIPWSIQEIRQLYHGPTARECTLQEPGVVIGPAILPIQAGVSGPIGRVPTLTVGLQMDPLARDQLPELSRGMIESYLADHLLVVEPTLYHDEQGRAYFSNDVRVACFEKAAPQRSMTPEAMVGAAVREFRSLGLYVPAEGSSEPSHPRTLVMAFRYTVIDTTLQTRVSDPKKGFELLFLHLLPVSAGESPKVTAFATLDDRTRLQELDTRGLMQTLSPSITAFIRFDEFRLMGLYPADPVVVKVEQDSRLSVPVETIRVRLGELAVSGVGADLSQILDELHAAGGGNEPAASVGSSVEETTN